jgi:hypothetical protein
VRAADLHDSIAHLHAGHTDDEHVRIAPAPPYHRKHRCKFIVSRTLATARWLLI